MALSAGGHGWLEAGRGMQLLLSPLLHHIPYTSVTQGPYYLKEINQEPSYGTAFLMPAPPNIDSSDSYTRRSQTTVPMCCFPPNPQCLILRLAHGVLRKGLGWEAPAPPVSGPPCLPGSRQKPELALPSQEDGGKATGQWAGPRASNCIALQGAVPSPTKHTHEATAPGPSRSLQPSLTRPAA